MNSIEYKDLISAGVHFGHLTRKWDPKMAPYIFMEKNGIHLIDLNKTKACLEDALAAVKSIVRSGKKVLFVATKKQAQEIVAKKAKEVQMPFVTERWLGGMLTNFVTVRKSLKKMATIEKLLKDEAFLKSIAKREKLQLSREKAKLEKLLEGIKDLSRLPSALFIVDIKKESIAVDEARKLGIPIFAMVDTNSNPNLVDFPVPANDDAFKSIDLITTAFAEAIKEAGNERKKDKEANQLEEEEQAKKEADLQEE